MCIQVCYALHSIWDEPKTPCPNNYFEQYQPVGIKFMNSYLSLSIVCLTNCTRY